VLFFKKIRSKDSSVLKRSGAQFRITESGIIMKRRLITFLSCLPDDNDAYVRAKWFAEGRGRAYIGYSESMNAMGDYANEVTPRLFSLGK